MPSNTSTPPLPPTLRVRHARLPLRHMPPAYSPSTAMCELVLTLCTPKSSLRTLSELYTLCKLEYHPTIPLRPPSFHQAGRPGPLEGVDPPRGIG